MGSGTERDEKRPTPLGDVHDLARDLAQRFGRVLDFQARKILSISGIYALGSILRTSPPILHDFPVCSLLVQAVAG